MAEVPIALAMVVSDAIWVDPGTGKKTILGTFSTIVGDSFPLTVSQIAIYIALTDAEGTIPLNLLLVDVDEERPPVISWENETLFPDKIAIAEGIMAFHNVVFPASGEYRIQLLSNLELIIERRLLVLSRSEAGDD